MFNIKGKERIELTPAELATFNTSYSQYLKKALTICRIRNCILITAGCSMLSNEVEIYRNGQG